MSVLKQLRTEKGWSFADLAKESGINKSTLVLLEGGRRKAQSTTLVKLARALGVKVEELAEYEDTGASARGRLGGAASKGVPKTKRPDVPESEQQ